MNKHKDELVTANITLTKEQWQALMCHVRHDVAWAAINLSSQVGMRTFAMGDQADNFWRLEAIQRIRNNGEAILQAITSATGIK